MPSPELLPTSLVAQALCDAAREIGKTWMQIRGETQATKARRAHESSDSGLENIVHLVGILREFRVVLTSLYHTKAALIKQE